jgi:hypothetical protein
MRRCGGRRCERRIIKHVCYWGRGTVKNLPHYQIIY